MIKVDTSECCLPIDLENTLKYVASKQLGAEEVKKEIEIEKPINFGKGENIFSPVKIDFNENLIDYDYQNYIYTRNKKLNHLNGWFLKYFIGEEKCGYDILSFRILNSKGGLYIGLVDKVLS